MSTRCAADELVVTFDGSMSALGNEYGGFSLESASRNTCTIFGLLVTSVSRPPQY
jgi:hypothetical protein